jgi:hypothetical protein
MHGERRRSWYPSLEYFRNRREGVAVAREAGAEHRQWIRLKVERIGSRRFSAGTGGGHAEDS